MAVPDSDSRQRMEISEGAGKAVVERLRTSTKKSAAGFCPAATGFWLQPYLLSAYII
jgi:hypothetical protein